MTIEHHRNMIFIDPKKVLWRYIDLEKFRDMLETRSLFFCRADKFSDPFEGSIPKNEFEYREQQGYAYGMPKIHRELKKFTLINCWHINDNESDAMWRLYLKTNEGVAVQTTVGKLCNALDKSTFIFRTSKVRYINYDSQIWYHGIDYPEPGYNLYVPFVHKRIEFRHENEFRILYDVENEGHNEDYWDNQPDSMGKRFEIDIDKIIDKVILPPTADEKIEEKVKRIMIKNNINGELSYSKLKDEPYY